MPFYENVDTFAFKDVKYLVKVHVTRLLKVFLNSPQVWVSIYKIHRSNLVFLATKTVQFITHLNVYMLRFDVNKDSEQIDSCQKQV